MIDLYFFEGLPVAVFGLGRSGLAAARALGASGAEVWAWDDSEDRRAAARDAGVPLVDLYGCDWEELTSLVLSPGVPLTHPAPHPVVTLALDAGCEVIGDIELLGRAERDAAYIGVTGTNGKSTTTALIGHVLELSGREVAVGGNFGIPALALEPMGATGTYVLEMSSYQLDLTRSITFDIAILLNISPDHLDRHGGMDGYVRAKRQIFHRQTRPRTAVVGVDDPHSRAIHDALRAADEQEVIPVSGAGPVAGGVYVDGGWLIDDSDGQAIRTLEIAAVATLPGAHNGQNAAAAYAAAKAAGVAPPVIAQCLRSYPGLVHRQELLDSVDGVRFVNDSKATNAASAARALASYDSIYWIAGGRPKGDDLDPLLEQLGRVRRAFLIGEAADPFAAVFDGRVDLERCGTLERAVPAAFAAAKAVGAGDAVVLLSPACASFDQFADFEARGDAFRALVEALPGRHVGPFDEEAA